MSGRTGSPALASRFAEPVPMTSHATIPWRDDAVVVRLPTAGGDREQVHSGRLWQVIEWVRDHPERDRLTIWLPERRVQPFCFDPDDIHDLLLRVDRPRGGIGFG